MLSRKEKINLKFEWAVFPRLDAAYNFVRWLTRDPANADDVVREAYLGLQILRRI